MAYSVKALANDIRSHLPWPEAGGYEATKNGKRPHEKVREGRKQATLQKKSKEDKTQNSRENKMIGLPMKDRNDELTLGRWASQLTGCTCPNYCPCGQALMPKLEDLGTFLWKEAFWNLWIRISLAVMFRCRKVRPEVFKWNAFRSWLLDEGQHKKSMIKTRLSMDGEMAEAFEALKR